MHLTANGVLSDYRGRILLQQTGDRNLALIGGSFEAGRLPTDTLARAFRDATALIVMPVRLTGLYYDSHTPDGALAFCWRCTMRGGDLQVPNGRPAAGFFDCPPLPAGLEPRYRRQVDQALHHTGGPIHMEREGEGLGAGLRRLFNEGAAEDKGQVWDVAVRLVMDAGQGQITWRRSGPGETWRLPAAQPAPGEAPWETAARLLAATGANRAEKVTGLWLVELAADRPAITLVFGASLDKPSVLRRPSETLAFAGFDQTTDQFAADDVRIVGGLASAAVKPVFRLADESF
jgi:ADP-ribose pyrophosphatase YjhB (NUDIX family)